MKAKTAKLVSRTALIKDLQHVLKVFPRLAAGSRLLSRSRTLF